MQCVVVGAGKALPVAIFAGQRVKRVFDRIAADGHKRPGSAIRVFRPVTTEVIGDLPAIDLLPHLVPVGLEFFPAIDEAGVDRRLDLGIEIAELEFHSRLDAELGQLGDDRTVRLPRRVVGKQHGEPVEEHFR